MPGPASRHGGDLVELEARRRALIERRGGGSAAANDLETAHGGAIVDFSASINPLGPPAWLRQVVSRSLDEVDHYPDRCGRRVVARASALWGIEPERVVVGPGTDELIRAFTRALRPALVVIPVPAYATYREAARRVDASYVEILMEPPGFGFPFAEIRSVLNGQRHDNGRPVLVWCGWPNNPTGLLPDRNEMRSLVEAYPAAVFAFDEAYAPFVSDDPPNAASGAQNVVSFRSLTKIFAIPGIRIGLTVAPPPIAAALRDELSAWPISCVAEAVAARCLQDTGFPDGTRAELGAERVRVAAALREIGVDTVPGVANFLLCSVTGQVGITDELLVRGIAVRGCSSFSGLDDHYFRTAIRSQRENDGLIAALRHIGHPAATGRTRPVRRAGRRCRGAAVMLQGTASNVGKSILTAALCRVLLQDGFSVAPFKAQNMSLNSFVTQDGGEIGRAQAVQAQACRLEPSVLMNPVLLKPSSDVGSQIVLMGKPAGFLKAVRFSGRRDTLFAAAKDAYDRLASEHDIVVLEGAGSPAEVNLKATEFVNMGMAAHAGASVYVVGDIDRGGVYAAFIGTMETFTSAERGLVDGFIVNKFRGDASLLRTAHDYVLDYTGKPVVGVVPHLGATGIPDEDSVSFKESAPGSFGGAHLLRIGLIDLPHISNFTDVDAFAVEPDTDVVRIVDASSFDAVADGWDIVVIPGSKNVFADLEWLRASGIAERIAAIAASTTIVGICGGLQMLGERILDRGGYESSRPARTEGLGLIPITTEFAAEKTLSRIGARHLPTGTDVTGYEIHHGVSAANGAEVVLERHDGVPVGWRASGNDVWGTYLHGLFDADSFRRTVLDRARTKAGLERIERTGSYSIEQAIERVASVFRSSVDMDRIHRAIRVGPV